VHLLVDLDKRTPFGVSVDGLSQLGNGVVYRWSKIFGVFRGRFVPVIVRTVRTLRLRLLRLLRDFSLLRDYTVLYSCGFGGLGSCWGGLLWGSFLGGGLFRRLGSCFRLRVFALGVKVAVDSLFFALRALFW
jgi:hypothetical protein